MTQALHRLLSIGGFTVIKMNMISAIFATLMT